MFIILVTLLKKKFNHFDSMDKSKKAFYFIFVSNFRKNLNM